MITVEFRAHDEADALAAFHQMGVIIDELTQEGYYVHPRRFSWVFLVEVQHHRDITLFSLRYPDLIIGEVGIDDFGRTYDVC